MAYITTSYSCPDLDGYSCSIAYAELLRTQGEQAKACIWGDVHIEVEWLIKQFNLAQPPTSCKILGDEQVVLLDASNPEDLPQAFKTDKVVEVIDHRKIHRGAEFTNAHIQIELVGAAATLVAERFQLANIVPSKESALLLFGGIISNTQNFTAINTERDNKMADWLREISNAPADLARQMFQAKSDLSGAKLQRTLLGDSKVLHVEGNVIGTAQLEIIGVKELLDTRRLEIEEVLQKIAKEHHCDYMFANIKDLKLQVSYLLCLDDVTCTLLKSVPEVEWEGRLGLSKKLTLRKQLTAWIDQRLKEEYV